MNYNNLSIIAIINYNKKNYCIYQMDQKIVYARLDNRHIKVDIDTNDLKILREFYNLIRYNKDYSIFCGDYKIKNNQYEIFLDTRSNLYTFVLDKDNKRYTPFKEDLVLLNSYFNNEKTVFFNQEQEDNAKEQKQVKKSKPSNFIRKVLKVGGITAVSLISAGIITYNLPQDVKSNIDYELGVMFRDDYTQKDKSYTFKDVENAIDENENISQQDKMFIKEVLEAEFEENKEYMDIETVLEKLETLNIQYDKYYTYDELTGKYNLTHEDDVRWQVIAYYDTSKNTMTCIEKGYSESEIEEKINEEFGFNEVEKSVYFHELNHSFTKFDIDSSLSDLAEETAFFETNNYIHTNLGIFEKISADLQKNFNTSIFRETVNEIFAQEYVDKYYQRTKDEKRVLGYSNHISYMYCLAEILPADILREYKFNDNDSIITEGLLNISDNKKEAYKLMTSLKSIDLYTNMVDMAQANNDSNYDIEQAKREQSENYKKIHDGLNYFYKAKYNMDISNDLNMLVYLYDTPVITDEEKQKVNEFLGVSQKNPEVQYKARGYFSKEYIESNPNVIAIYLDNNENVQSFEITDRQNWDRQALDDMENER